MHGSPQSSKQDVRVLLVEDDQLDAQILHIFSQSFVNFSPRITHVTDIKSAVDALSKHSFDVCMLDYWIGPQSSLKFLTDIEATKAKMAKIIISNIPNSQVNDMKLTSNGALFISKGSCSAKILESAVERAMSIVNAFSRAEDEPGALVA